MTTKRPRRPGWEPWVYDVLESTSTAYLTNASKRIDVEVVLAATETRVPRDVCCLCDGKIKDHHAVLRITDRKAAGQPQIRMHKSCMATILIEGINDEPAEQEYFEQYVSGVAEKLGLATH